MSVMNLPLPLQTYKSPSRPLSSQRLLNMYIENPQDPNTQDVLLLGAPGLTTAVDLSNLTTVPCLGVDELLWRGTGLHYFVIANETGIYITRSNVAKPASWIFSITWDVLGMTAPESHVKMANNGDDILILNAEAGRMVIVTPPGPTDTELMWNVREPTDSGYETFIQGGGIFIDITMINSVFAAVCKDNSGAYLRWGDVLNPNVWDYVAQLDASPNELTGVSTNGRELWVFSPTNIIILAPTGEAGDTFFASVGGATINKGTQYKSCIAVDEASFFFLGSDDAIYASRGYNLAQISTAPIINMVKKWGKPQNVIGQFFYKEGHRFYVLKIKFAGQPGKSLWYDLETKSWSEREGIDGKEWRGDYLVKLPNAATYITSIDLPKLYLLDTDAFTDDGDPIPREFVFPSIVASNKNRMLFYSMTLDLDTGLGQGDDLIMDWSDDGGNKFEKPRRANLGVYGEFSKKVQFRRLGSALNRIFRVKMVTSSPVHVLRAYMDVEECEA